MKAAIPTPEVADPGLRNVLTAMKTNIDSITGQQKNSTPLKPLPSTASNADIIAQLNAILNRIQG